MEAVVDLGPGAAFDHVAVAAPHIRDLLPIYRDLLGGDFVVGGDNVRVGYRAVQLAYRNRQRVELMEPLPGSTFLDSFLRHHPTGGVHHLTFLVDDLDHALATARAQGFAPIGEHRSRVQQEMFLHPREAHGVLLQVVVRGPGYDSLLGHDLTLEDVLAGKVRNGVLVDTGGE